MANTREIFQQGTSQSLSLYVTEKFHLSTLPWINTQGPLETSEEGFYEGAISSFMFLDRKVIMRIENIEIKEDSQIRVITNYDESDWIELMKYEYWNCFLENGI